MGFGWFNIKCCSDFFNDFFLCFKIFFGYVFGCIDKKSDVSDFGVIWMSDRGNS